ncbi:MAG: hypothetical protein PUE21_01740 [Lachnospiraceae bacterium]|nr:hypothetical protein [Lachnospiraceae bacterium]
MIRLEVEMNTDSILLLKECDAGCRMGVDSMMQARSYAENPRLLAVIEKYLERHKDFGDKCHRLLNAEREETQEPPKMASAFAKISMDMKMLMEKDSAKISEILVDGCNMGVKSLTEKMHKYANADEKCINLATELIEMEQKMSQDLLQFL